MKSIFKFCAVFLVLFGPAWEAASQWNIVPGKVDDPRYNIAEKVILGRNEVSLEAMRAVLSATHKEWSYPTIYSYICDLKSLTLHVYNFHNFEEDYVFNVPAELERGVHEYDLPALFAVEPYASIQHRDNAPKLGVAEIEQKLAEGGVEAAVAWYQGVKDSHREVPNYVVYEGVLQQVGNDLLSRDEAEKALDTFRFASRIFPESADCWELQGDAWLELGDPTQARTCYEKALELGSQTPTLTDKLEKLRDR